MGWFKKKEPEPRRALDPLEIEHRLKSFIASKTQVVGESEITAETKLFSAGLLDSLAFIELVAFIETGFKIRLSDAIEVNVDNMDSVGQLVDAVVKAGKK